MINDAPGFPRMLVALGRNFRKDGDHTTGRLDFKFLAALKPALRLAAGGITSGVLLLFLTTTVMLTRVS